jgi:hypothetical protein
MLQRVKEHVDVALQQRVDQIKPVTRVGGSNQSSRRPLPGSQSSLP